MPRPRFEKLPADKRQRILETAAREFASRGFEHASLNRIITAAGISKGAAYYYFDDKADLFATVVLQGWQVLIPDTEIDLSLLDADAFWPVLLGLYAEMRQKAHERPWLTAVGKLVYGRPPSKALGGLVAEQFAEARRWLAALVERGQAIGAVRADVPGPLLIGMVAAAAEAADRWIVDRADDLPPGDMEAVALGAFDMLRRLVEPGRGRRGDDAPGPVSDPRPARARPRRR